MALFDKASLLFLSCLTFHSSAAASENAKTINGHIVCDNVVRSVGLSTNEDGSFSHDKTFYCVVDPVYTSGAGMTGVRLKLSNLPSTFERDWKRVTADGNTSAGLNLREVVIEDGTNIRLPDRPTTMVALKKNVFANLSLQRAEQYDVPLLSWKTNASSTGGFSSETNGRDRNLAVNQSGEKIVLVVRITTSTYGSPQNTAAEMSSAVFSGDAVTLQSQYSACSYGALTLNPATDAVNGLPFSASGVVDVSLSTTDATYTGGIRNLARAAIGASSNGQLVGVDHIIYAVVSLMTGCVSVLFCVDNLFVLLTPTFPICFIHEACRYRKVIKWWY